MKAVLALLYFSACAVAPVRPVQKLSDVQGVNLEVRFLGTPYDPAALYICSGVHNDFACVGYSEFMRQLTP